MLEARRKVGTANDEVGKRNEGANVNGSREYNEEECAFDVINAAYRYYRNITGDETSEDDEPALNGIVNMTDDVMSLRDKRGLKRYYEMPLIRKGSMTGVEVKFMSSIRKENRTTFIGTENAFADAEAEVRLSERIGEVEGNADKETRNERIGDEQPMMQSEAAGAENGRHDGQSGSPEGGE